MAVCLSASLLFAQSPLQLQNNYFVTGDYVVGGVGLRGLGVNGLATRTISIPDQNWKDHVNSVGVPAGADIVAAFLYWQTVESSSASLAGQRGFFLGYPITGEVLGDPSSPVVWSSGGCSGSSGGSKIVHTYRADVRPYLPIDPSTGNVQNSGNGDYVVSLADSGTNGAQTPFTLGASLVIVYRLLSKGALLKSVVLYDGAYSGSNASQNMSQQIVGFYQAAAGPDTKFTHIVGNGQPNKLEDAYLNGTQLTSLYTSLYGADAPAFPGFYNGSWDNPTWIPNNYSPAPITVDSSSASALVMPASTNKGCVSWGAIVFSTTVPNADGDGLLNAWKQQGGYQDVSTGQLVSLPGASQPGNGKQDLFVEIDWLENRNSDGSIEHTHLPKQQALDMVGTALARHNINVHFDLGPGVYQGDPYVVSYADPLPPGTIVGGNAISESLVTCTDAAPDLCVYPNQPAVGWDAGFLVLKDAANFVDSLGNILGPAGNFQHGRKDSYHYVLFGHALGFPRSMWTAFGSTINDSSVPKLVSIVVTAGTATVTIQSPPDSLFKTYQYLKPGDQLYCDQLTPSHHDQNCDRVTITGALQQWAVNGTFASLNGTYQWTTPPATTDNTTVFTVATSGVPDGTYNYGNEPLLAVTYGGPTSTSGRSDLGGADSTITFGLWPADNLFGLDANGDPTIPCNPNPLLGEPYCDDKVGTVEEQAGTLMHELGHSIALTHGGAYDAAGNPSDLAHAQAFEPNCKPNYLSIMSYQFQVDLLGDPDTPSGNVLDYSGFLNPPLDETAALWSADYWTKWYTATPQGSPARYHCDGTPALATDYSDMYGTHGQPSSVPGGDINFDGSSTDTLHDYDDWGFIDLRQVGATGSEFLSADGLLNKNGGLLNKNGGLLNKNGGLLNKNGGLLNKNGGLLNKNGGLLNKNGGLLNKNGGVGNDKDSTNETHTSIVRPPRNLTAALMHWSSGVQLDWKAPRINVIRSYKIHRAVIAGTGTAADYTLAGAPPATTYQDTNIEGCVTYRYSVSAVDAEGRESEKTSVDQPIPCAPSGLTATLTGHYVTLNWTAASDTSGAIYQYNIYRGVGAPATTLYATVLASSTTYLDQGVANDTTYNYAVTAVLADSSESSPATVSGFFVHWTVPQTSTLIVNVPNPATYGQTYTLTTSGGSGTGAVSYVLNSGPCTLVGDQLTANGGSGFCVVTATKAGDYDYDPISSSPTTVPLGKANATIVVTPYNVMYDGSPHTATGTVNGVANSGLNLSGTTHTYVGTYNDTWTFTDSSGNYASATGTVTDVIVGYTFIGFLSPLHLVTSPPNYSGSFNLGKAVPIKWQLKNSSGAYISNLSTLAGLTAIFNGKVSVCSASLPALGSLVLYSPSNGVTGNSTFRYDTTNQQFVFNWDTTSVTIAPTNFGAGCYTLVLQLADGSPAKKTLLQLR